jgi:hypothetical protein
MNETYEKPRPQRDAEATPSFSSDAVNQPDTPNRRQLIERYGKYALVAAPLLLFASKARAIHSVP